METNNKMKNNKIHMIIWGALLYSQVIYVVLVYLQTKDLISFDFENAKLALPLVLIACICGFASFALPKTLLKKQRPQDYTDAIKQSFVPLLLKWILAEAIVICGLVLSLDSMKNLIIPFFLCTVIIFLISFPSQNNIKRMTGLLRN